ncbi:MAG TPA: amidohydrolase family protein [Pirellulales bacterium]|jgi:guanine deaminase|nr:amidohydrolase family protein [Pirellulales bacterium]
MSKLGAIRGPMLNPRAEGSVDFWPDGVIVGDSQGRIVDAGRWEHVAAKLGLRAESVVRSQGIIIPAMLDAHIHIPQFPVRGYFVEGIGPHPADGRLLAGLNRNVFPAEARCADIEYARQVTRDFLAATLAQGTVGGAAYMTVHTAAARVALELLPDTWSVGPVLMNQNCPDYLRTDEPVLTAEVESMAHDFGRRLIVTDRFALSVTTPLRRRAVELAKRLDLRMQTHLNEQLAEKRFVEETLYPDYDSYTDVYRRDGLLDCDPILAHCVWMSGEEFDLLAGTGSFIAHCPVSNTLLGSGVMPIDEVLARKVPYALCTDVGASPTVSLLCEMIQFLRVHAQSSLAATPSEALYRTTLAPAVGLNLADRLGSFEPGKETSFIEVACDTSPVVMATWTADEAIARGVLGLKADDLPKADSPSVTAIEHLRVLGLEGGAELDLLTDEVQRTAERVEHRVLRVVVAGRTV